MQQQDFVCGGQLPRRRREGRIGYDSAELRATVGAAGDGLLHGLVAHWLGVQLALEHGFGPPDFRDHVYTLVARSLCGLCGPARVTKPLGAIHLEIDRRHIFNWDGEHTWISD